MAGSVGAVRRGPRGLGPEITRLLTTDWHEPEIRPALVRLLRLYGTRPTTRSYLDSLGWLPEG